MDNMKHQGLNDNEVSYLREKFGENSLPTKGDTSPFLIFFSQFKNPLIYILVFITFLSLIFKENVNAALIMVVIIVNVLMGFFQEYSAQRTLAALRKILKPQAVVIRNNLRREIEAKYLVPGDLVVLSAGNRVPADGTLLEGINLLASEAILTGEEEPIKKTTEEGSNSLFMGTTVISGKGILKVVKIGKETEVGKISQSLGEIKKEQTPLQIKLEKFTHKLAVIIVGICLAIFLVGIIYGQDPLEMLKISIVLSVAAIPEGLPIVITIILALGMRRILKRKGLVKKLISIETLGSTSVICTDKTGTLTEGIMRVEQADFRNKEKAFFGFIINNEQKSGLEIAIWNYLKGESNLDPQEVFNLSKKIYEEPFDSEKKYALAVAEENGKETAFIVGAPEIILSFCKISKKEKNEILAKIEDWASQGLRILGIIFKDKGDLREKSGFSYLGLIGIKDPVRPGAKEAIAIAQKAGIKVKIVTGDYRKTAEKVAAQVGLVLKPENILDGDDLDVISEEELKDRIDDILLFARVTPHEKMKIVKVLQEKGEIVAMTGDGINDAPALKKADIGISVGNASDVAKETSDLILIDSNFKTIVAACEEGRLIFSNIKKVVGYVLSNSFVEMVLVLGAVILDFPAPLTVIQILWIHLICDGPPDITLAFEPKDSSLMEESPKDIKKEGILSGPMLFLIFSISLATGLLALVLFRYFYNQTGDLTLARTIAFATAATVDLVYIFAFKNLKKLIIHTENFFQNKYLILSVIYGFALLFSAIYLPQLNRFLGTVPLEPSHWLLVFGVSLITVFFTEAVKMTVWRKR